MNVCEVHIWLFCTIYMSIETQTSFENAFMISVFLNDFLMLILERTLSLMK